MRQNHLNAAPRAAVEHGVSDVESAQTPGPLLIIAGAGTEKTSTLANRVAHLILTGSAPERILLLTFTRRAAAEMTRRAQHILGAARAQSRQRLSIAERDLLVWYVPCDRQPTAA
jgi:DNA helicase-2/ATP-dependent DNA helicase PcrA